MAGSSIGLGALLLCTSLTAQAVSPSGYATVPGTSGYGEPWTRAGIRYQQIHGDLRGAARLIKGQAHRRYGSLPEPGAVARTLEIEMWAGEGSLSTFSSVFAQNYLGQRVNVVRKKTILLPDWTRAPSRTPAPWDLVIPYDQPLFYSGAPDLVWEVVVTSSSASTGQTAYADAVNDSWASTFGTAIGTGCVASGQTMPMRLTSVVLTILGNRRDTVQPIWSVSNAPDSPSPVLLLGTTDPGFVVPGLCAALHTDGAVALPTYPTGRAGNFQTAPMQMPYQTGLLLGTLHAQAASLDAGQGPVAVSLSNGDAGLVPRLPAPQPFARVFGIGASSTGGSLMRNQAIVTRFDT